MIETTMVRARLPSDDTLVEVSYSADGTFGACYVEAPTHAVLDVNRLPEIDREFLLALGEHLEGFFSSLLPESYE